MPYVSRELLRLALEALQQEYSPLLTVSVPCMLASKLPTVRTAAEAETTAIKFGAREERAWLEKFFKPGGGPLGSPYYMPATRGWVQELYPGRALQRLRKQFEVNVFFHPTSETWALRQGAAKPLAELVLQKKPAVPLVALMAWMWRTREIESLENALDGFIRELGIDRDGLIGTVYSRDIPEEFKTAGLSETPLTDEAIAELTGASPPPPQLPSFAETIARIEEELGKQHIVLVPGLVQRIIGGWLVGDVVVLVGPTGSGKTRTAIALGRSLEALIGSARFSTSFIAVTREYDAAQFLGYENLSGEFMSGQLAREILFVGEPTDPRLVILDEWNLAQIDAYFGQILSLLETGRPLALPGRVDLRRITSADEVRRAQPEMEEGKYVLPEDTFWIATCNSWADEPETRLPVSGPVKRRCRVILMPNVLELKLAEAGVAGIAEACDVLLRQEREAIAKRLSTQRGSIWDGYRAERLHVVATFGALEEHTREKLLQLARVLLQDPYTKSYFTIGILRDILLSCVYAMPAQEYAALGEEVADKVFHQMQGESKLLDVIVDLCKDLPNAKELAELARKMGAFGGEKRIRPLL